MNKVCRLCKVDKDISLFHKNHKMKDGHLNFCKECQNKNTSKNQYWLKNSKKCQERFKKWKSKSNKNRIDCNFQSYMTGAVRHRRSGGAWEKFVGYTTDELIKHLEILFTDEMSWDNYGKYWQIDHIIPKNNFVYEDEYDAEFVKCWALNNLRPLSKVENRVKYNKILQNP